MDFFEIMATFNERQKLPEAVLLKEYMRPDYSHKIFDDKRLHRFFFLEALAQDRRERAIGVILSGTATDGTLGLEAIKA